MISWPRLRAILAYVIAAGLIAYAAWWAWQNWDKVRAAFLLSPAHLAALVPLVVASVLLFGLLNQVMAAHLGAVLRLRQWATLAFASTLANYILPLKAGAAMRAAYLKKNHDLPLSQFASSMAVAYVVTILANCLVGAAGLGVIALQEGVMSWPLLGGLLGMAALCAALLAFSPRASQRRAAGRFWGVLVRIHVGWDLLRHSPSLLAKSAGLALATSLVYAVRLRIAFAAVGHTVSLPGCLLVGALVALSMFISITPASLGIREAAILFSSMAIGVTPEVSLLAGTVDRAVAILVVAALGPPAMTAVSREMARTPHHRNRP
jgi:uncharacterized membrane protein YbhN (UPF0104 family)